MIISLIAAVSENNVIGIDGVIPWEIIGEQSRFKELTIGNTIIMGRKTYESIGKPLPKRKTIIISRTKNILSENCVTVNSLAEAFNLVKDEEEVFVSGGGEIYKEALIFADKIYLTVIHKKYKGNIYFPNFNKDNFKLTYKKRIEGNIPYTYYTYERKTLF
jgi:dihydrofolate reductase (trimethoprim resistance protein)